MTRVESELEKISGFLPGWLASSRRPSACYLPNHPQAERAPLTQQHCVLAHAGLTGSLGGSWITLPE